MTYFTPNVSGPVTKLFGKRPRGGISLIYTRSSNAVTMLELLAVIVIMVVVAALALPSFKSFGQANLLTSSGDQIVNLANFARENSMSKNGMTVLVMLSDPALEGMNRTFTLFEITPPKSGAQNQTSDWKQISKWETLSQGVIADSCTFPDQSQQPQPPLPAIKYKGATSSVYKFITFLPNGAMLSGSSAQIRFCAGLFQAGSITPRYTEAVVNGVPANYYNVTILAATGRTKIDRP